MAVGDYHRERLEIVAWREAYERAVTYAAAPATAARRRWRWHA